MLSQKLPRMFTFRTNASRAKRVYQKNHPEETSTKLVITKISDKAFLLEKVAIESASVESNPKSNL